MANLRMVARINADGSVTPVLPSQGTWSANWSATGICQVTYPVPLTNAEHCWIGLTAYTALGEETRHQVNCASHSATGCTIHTYQGTTINLPPKVTYPFVIEVYGEVS